MSTEWTTARTAAADSGPMSIVGGTWVHTPPTVEEVDPVAILGTLAGVLRWNGRLGPTCTVAAHTWALLRWAELARNDARGLTGRDVAALSNADYNDLRRALLVHDWHEAWTGDITAPTKKAMRELVGEGGDAAQVDALQSRIDAAIRTRLDFILPFPDVQGLTEGLDFAICSAECIAWEMRPDLLFRVFAKHGEPDPLAVVASLEAKRLSERCPDPIRRALDGDEFLPPIVSFLRDEFDCLFPNHERE